jgi:hypothetical protein
VITGVIMVGMVAMHYEKSDEPRVAMMVELMTHRTCLDGCRGRLGEDKTRPSEGVLVWIESRLTA